MSNRNYDSIKEKLKNLEEVLSFQKDIGEDTTAVEQKIKELQGIIERN